MNDLLRGGLKIFIGCAGEYRYSDRSSRTRRTRSSVILFRRRVAQRQYKQRLRQSNGDGPHFPSGKLSRNRVAHKGEGSSGGSNKTKVIVA